MQEIVRKGRRFIAVGVEPYQRLNGTWTTLKHWQGECRQCGAPFVVTTPGEARSLARSHSFERVNCEAHKGMRAKA